jgi:hypothetical protein
MSLFGKVAFSGSRFIFWSLAPVLLACAFLLPFLVKPATTANQCAVTGGLEAFIFLLLFGLYDPQRYWWALRVVATTVFAAYVLYFIHEAFILRTPFKLFERPGAASSTHALLGLIVIGLPCLRYAILGRWTWRKEEEITSINHEEFDD